ncbi:MAG TPA: TerC family protein [Burkholderiales bacterium]|nr:TerC family protein [Burkholderiales bacterium]
MDIFSDLFAGDFLSAEFLSALGAIVVIDLVLAGDNAVVIALAARNVAAHLRRRAVLWGTVGAVAARIVMTLGVVWLLDIPGLLGAGGLLLVWIACKLLLPEREDAGTRKPETAGFAAAIRTIIVADVVMGVDNVLGVAGAAHGSFVLVVAGLAISIPIVVWGSGVLMRFMDRFPAIIYVGAGVLAFTAAKMLTDEPLLKGVLSAAPWSTPLIYTVIVLGVLWAGFAANGYRLQAKAS